MSNYDMTNPYEIAKFIKDSTKSTPVTAYIKTDVVPTGLKFFTGQDFVLVIDEYEKVKTFIDENSESIEYWHLENDRRNSAIPLLDKKEIDARIEPGAFIRDRVKIGKSAVIMMGAIINIGAEIGDGTMIDMGAVLGARATVGKNSHVGAGAVLAGVLEPPSATPVIVEDDVMIGANAVVLEGVRIGKGSVVAAGSIVTKDVPPNAVVAGAPARVIKEKDEKTIEKTEILEDLR